MSKGLPQHILRAGFQLKLSASVGDAGPKWQKIFPLGETRHRSDFGDITFSREWLTEMLGNYVAEGKPERPWDYFHRGLSGGDPDVRNEDKVAAGWFSDMQLRDDGLYVLTRFTDKARRAIEADELRYPSPTFIENATDPKTGAPCGPKLLAVALLNDPFLTDLPPVEASENPKHPKGTSMKLALSQLVSALKLSADTTEDNLETALQLKAVELDEAKKAADAAKAEAAKLKEQVELSSKKDGTAGELIRKLTERVDAQAAELKKLADAKAADAVTALQVKLETEGRIRADQKPLVAELVAAVGLEKATSMAAGWPVVVDLKERGTNKPGPQDGMPPAEAHKQLQLKAAEIAKANPEQAVQAYHLAAKANPDLAKAAAKLSEMKPEELDAAIPLSA